MTEQGESLSDPLLKVKTVEELEAAIPRQIADKLGEGKAGVDKTITLLVDLAHFAPAPSTFSRDSFDKLIAVDYKTGNPLPPEEQQKLVEVALEAGFIQKADMPGERYSISGELQDAIKRAIGVK